ncbi:MAG: hypothetical protein HZC46_06455 [Ignavibacterium album]|jgi:hypothetical protein|uniref:hypothetical protein n=1 Tax=Ignavibacterium album TaxID=591197 RepID=UPI0026ED3158|nr:hypothetical protein [Ignavibacterium album]MBI5661768.1 hypothetical protein [Ignavibacterium album]
MNEENFIAGIYNYCDRWCERCNYTDRCRLFRTDAEKDIQHILYDEDPHDPKVFTKDIEDSLNEAMQMLMEKLKEMNIDPEDIQSEELPPEPVFESYPINNLAEEFTKSMDLLDNLYNSYSEKIKEGLLKENLTQELREINEGLSVFGWYSPQVFVKTKRLIRAHEEYFGQEDEKMREIDEEELFVTGKLLYIAVTNSLSALNNLHEHCSEFNSEILEHISLLTRINEELMKMYPEIPEYRRPYFD